MKTTTQIGKKARVFTDEINKVSIRTGLVISVMLMGYFLIMKISGLAEILSLRALNFVFLAGGILFLLRKFSNKEGKTEYLNGLKIGALTSIYASVPFAVFMLIYLNFDKEFMMYIHENAFMGGYLNPVSAASVILIEGTVSGTIFTYIIMPFFKKE